MNRISVNGRAHGKTTKSILFNALMDAISYHEGLIDAYRNMPEDPQAIRSKQQIAKYINLKNQLADELGLSRKSALDEMIDNAETISVIDLVKNKGKLPDEV